MDKRIIIGSGAALILLGGGVAVSQLGGKDKVTLNNPQRIVWQKPTTDAAWAEDVKAESFDIKSTGKLTEMRDTHAAKLQKVIAGKAEELNCQECIEFKLRQAHPDWSAEDVSNEYQNQYNHALYEIEKLQQSVERMDKELELREKGFVQVEGEKQEGLLGGLTKPYATRQIND